MKTIFKKIFFVIIALIVFVVLGSFALYAIKKPHTSGPWELGQERLARVQVGDGTVSIENLRDFNWETGKEPVVRYEHKTFTLSDIESLQVVESHFSAFDAIAHVFLIFKLKDGSGVAVSVESRREQGEEFTLLGGLTAQYELMYVVGTERDLLGLRDARNEHYTIYNIKATPAQVQKLFAKLANNINDAHKHLRFYHLFTHNCTNTITRAVRNLNDTYNFSFVVTTFAPGKVGKMLHSMGLVIGDDVVY